MKKLAGVFMAAVLLPGPICMAQPRMTAPQPSAAVAAAINAPDRPAEDVARDAARHTAELLAFSGVKPGDRIADFVPGKGFFTRLFSHIAGPQGHVFAVVPSELAKVMPPLADAVRAVAAQPAYANVTAVVEPAAQTGTAAEAQGGKLDVVWTDDNYHDVYGFFGPAAAAGADAAIFHALKPGGMFVVIDHIALGGTSSTAPATLHRIDPDTVKAQVLAAGFVLDASSDVLRNPADAHTAKVFDPSIKGHTDQFAFRFRKPAP